MPKVAQPREEKPAAVIAPRLRMTRDRVVRRIQTGELRGRHDPERGWLVDVASVEEYLAQNPPDAA